MEDKVNMALVCFGFDAEGSRLTDRWITTTSTYIQQLPVGHYPEELLQMARQSHPELPESYKGVLAQSVREVLVDKGSTAGELAQAEETLTTAVNALAALVAMGVPMTLGLSGEITVDGSFDLPAFSIRSTRSITQ